MVNMHGYLDYPSTFLIKIEPNVNEREKENNK